jgi:hypothetical protein
MCTRFACAIMPVLMAQTHACTPLFSFPILLGICRIGHTSYCLALPFSLHPPRPLFLHETPSTQANDEHEPRTMWRCTNNHGSQFDSGCPFSFACATLRRPYLICLHLFVSATREGAGVSRTTPSRPGQHPAQNAPGVSAFGLSKHGFFVSV